MPQQRTLYAVLIGINGYASRPLSGCINDVMAISDHFEKLCSGQEAGRIIWKPAYYLEPGNEEEGRYLDNRGITYQRPIRQNIIDAFSHFEAASPETGDFCLLYYSGHGSYMEAPEVFRDIEPTGAVQSIVCIDSREPGQRDLIDKELGYLIARTLEGKAPYGASGEQARRGVHFLAIMDCCHSGTNTRDADVVARMEDAGSGVGDAADILGFTTTGNCFYRPFADGQQRVRPGGLKHARYINLAAARDSELAQEKTLGAAGQRESAGGPVGVNGKHGIFTYSLLCALEQNGSNISYRELMRQVEMEVRSRVARQIPVLGSSQFEDDNQLFLRNEFHIPEPEYNINWRAFAGSVEWYANAGAIQGFVPSGPEHKALLRLLDGTGRTPEVVEVRAGESILSSDMFTEEDKANKALRAVVEKMPFPRVAIGLGKNLPPAMKQSLEQAWQAFAPRFVSLAADVLDAEYEVGAIAEAGGGFSYILTRPGSNIPLFVRHSNASVFMDSLEKVGRWESVLRLNNPYTGIRRQDILVEASVLEGVPFDEHNLNDIPLSAYRVLRPGPDTIELACRRKGGEILQPALKLKVTNLSRFDDYWVGALYLDNQYGITHEYLPPRQIGWDAGQDFAELGYDYEGMHYSAIPMSMDERYHQYGVAAIQDYLILTVSKQPFSLERYFQLPLAMDTTRGPGEDTPAFLDKDDWMAIRIPIVIRLPVAAFALQGGQECVVAGLTLRAPGNFTAQAQLTTRAAARRLAQAMQGGGEESQQRALLPPGHLWAKASVSEAVFSRGLPTAPDGYLSILELTDVRGSIGPEAPLVIIPVEPLGEGEAIIPFGYETPDETYIQLGFTDEQGAIVIHKLPQASPGIIGPDGQEEGAGNHSSVKLFFHRGPLGQSLS
ncbi:MAG: caspase family protein [Lewinellaceae bacterium]|nr:caspase family protein [Lewinellaceae bacterium]